MRRLGLARLELLMGSALVAAVLGLGVVVLSGISSRNRMSEARRDVAELGALVAPVPAGATIDSAPPKVTRRRAKKKAAPAARASTAPGTGPSSPLSDLPSAPRDEDADGRAETSSDGWLTEPDENGPSIFLLAPLEGLMDDDDEPAGDDDVPVDAPADTQEPPPADGATPEPRVETPLVEPDRP